MYHFKFATDNPAPDPRLSTPQDAERVGKTLLTMPGLISDVLCRRAAPHEIPAPPDGDYMPFVYTFTVKGQNGNTPRLFHVIAAEAIARHDAESTGYSWHADLNSGSLVRVEVKKPEKK